MDIRGETSAGKVGLFVGLFITILVGLILLQSSAQNVGEVTNTIEMENRSLSTIVNWTPQYITDIRAISNVVIFNETNDAIIGAANYTVENNVVYQGALAVEITPNATGPGGGHYITAWQVSGTTQPLGYIPDSGARSVAGMIIIFFALAIAIVTLVPTLREKIFGM